MVKIKVPATSANLGVGFDCLGLALNMYSYFTFSKSNEIIITGCEPRFQNEDNLVYTSFQKALKALGFEQMPVEIDIQSDIPVSRGLGSSATCVVGGVLGAFALTQTPIDKELVLKICTEIEGHPDNVAPAIYGGLVASYTDEQANVHFVSYPIDERYNFLACVPDFETSTQDARAVLPEVIPFEKAVSNFSKLSIVLKGFEMYDSDLLSVAMADDLHEPYRKQLIHGYEKVQDICDNDYSVCFYISGSGSTLMNVMRDTAHVDVIAKQLEKLPNNWQCRPLQVDMKGATLC